MAEVRIDDNVLVEAPASVVWQVVKDPAAHAQWHPFVTTISGEHHLGATRTCAVSLGKKRGQTRERCVVDDNERRIAWAVEEDSSGFLRLVKNWTAGFQLEARDGASTQVTAESVFEPRNPLVRLMLPMVRGKFHGAQRAILAGLKAAAEGQTPRSSA